MEGSRNGGPYKATKMWSEMVKTFQDGIPLRRHRRHIKVYDNCFTGQEAVNWFQSVLQNHLHVGNTVTKEQTVQLLNKFLKAGVFQNINALTPFDPHYHFLKEGDLYHLSDVSSTRLPLANKSQNIPPKSRPNQWSVKNTDRITNKGIISTCSQSEMGEPRFDAHHTVGLPTGTSSAIQTTTNKLNCHAAVEEIRPAVLVCGQHTRSKSDVCPRQNVQHGTNYQKASFNQEQKDYGSVQTNIHNIPFVKNHSHHGRSEQYSTQYSSAYEKQVKEALENPTREYSDSSVEQGKVHSEGHLKSARTNICSTANSRDNTKDLGSSGPYTDCCKWLQPLTFDNIDICDMQEGTSMEPPCMPVSAALGYEHLKKFTALSKSQTIQRSSSRVQPKPDPSKPYANLENHDSEKSAHSETIPGRSTDVSGLTKPLQSEVNSATLRRNPHLNVNNIALPGENAVGYCGSEAGRQIHYQTSASQLKYNQNNVTASRMQEKRYPFRRSGSLGFARSSCDDPITATVSETLRLFEVGEIWKEVVLARLEKHTLGWNIPFRFELQTIPGEWLSANASSEVYLDSHFPESLVAAMNCLVHWPQAVPNEILTAFKEHYFKLQEPLTTFNLYSVLTKVFLCVATGNLAMSNEMVSRQSELSTNGLLSLVLPPNSCFETAFTSDSPITRVVPQRCVDTLHFSQHGKQNKNVPLKRMSGAPNLCEPSHNVQATHKGGRQSGTKRQTSGKRGVKTTNRKVGRRVRIGVEEDRKLCHFRNKSGGYVNPALSKSTDDSDADDLLDTAKIHAHYNLDPEQELDYVAALESLNTLMRCTRRNNPSVAAHGQCVGLEFDIDQNGSQSSESSSYYTAVSSSSSEANSRRSSGVLVESLESVNTGGMCMNIEESGEKLMVTVMQLVLLCIPVHNRIQLQYLLHFMNQWNVHHSLCVQSDVVNIFTPTILRSECEANFDVTLARSIVCFLMSHHELVLSVPSDLKAEVQFLVSSRQANSVNHQEGSVTYCQQVSSQQFEHQRVTGSQLALSELLEQILSDCKMGPKEKRKRLKLFQESYPHIYHRHFPDLVQDKALKKQPRGLFSLATLSRLKSMRV